MKENFIMAIATNDGKHFIKDHFGDAKYFQLYSLGSDLVTYLDRIENNSEEEKKHADPKKAKSISQILNKKSVTVLVGNAFGGNIVRMKRKFVCIKCSYSEIANVFPLLLDNFDKIQAEWEKGEERDFIVL
jgi:predicted Fe-Mo cluster-binding NifX family protein